MTSPSEPTQTPTGPTVGQNLRAAVDNPWLVLATVFFVTTAVFGLPLIWLCRAWSTPMKILISAIAIVYTAIVFWLFYLAMLWCYTRISESLS